MRDEAGGFVKRFYAERDYKPLWIVNGRLSSAAEDYIGYLRTADLDGLRPSSYGMDDLRDAIADARSNGDPAALAHAELMLSDSFGRFVRDQRRPVGVGMVYADRKLRPRKLKPDVPLRAAALSGPFATYVGDMAWMSPHYVRLRTLLARAEKAGSSEEDIDRIRLNLDRARVLPGPWTMHIVVDASSARLWYYQAGKLLGTMKVVVGAEATQTPMMAGTLQWAILNPYWNIPDYLAEKNIAPKVLSGRSLTSMHIEALSDWSANPQRLAPETIDWQAVASGKDVIRLRELPGAANSMGKVKFLFPNDEGIYLHDTPNRDLLDKPDRHLSNGCIRLEDAPGLGRWLLQKSIATASKTPEQYTPLPVQVPVYLTYLTATETDKGIAFRPDIYGRDK
ncbi:MAG TPA: L,D-transpeptidase family protein [Sphingobium sp.]|uniref:L,D-transpeptidase family protein n=1 Tax=Sphingobium sp. TaxID=1912891 RepID=UPI002ED64757